MSPETRDKLVVYSLGALLAVLVALNLGWFLRGGADHDDLLDQPAPTFAVPRLDQQGELRLDDLRGRVVLLDFWAIYCGPCKRQMPALQELHRDLQGKDVTILSINTDDPREADRAQRVQDYIQQGGYTFPVALDSGATARDFGVQRIPTLVIIDREGSIRYIHTGLAPKEELAREIQRLLAAPPRA